MRSSSFPADLSRRNFLQCLGALGLTAPLVGSPFGTLFIDEDSLFPGVAPSPREPLPKRPPGSAASSVLVVGAGIAGLEAARQLTEAGHDGDRWWIMSLLWHEEWEGAPIPERYTK